MRLFAAGLSALVIAFAAPGGAALAQAGDSTVTLADGTTIVTTFRGLNDITIKISGGNRITRISENWPFTIIPQFSPIFTT